MKRATAFAAGLVLAGATVMTAINAAGVHAATSIAGETFMSHAMSGSSWLSGGNSPACLTAAGGGDTNPIPACDTETPVDTEGNGALRLTTAANSESGFAIYNTPISTGEGLDVQFKMYQYGGTGADGIAFFLIDGAASPTQPGAYGGSLGYSSNTDGDPGIVGGYVGVGFDRYGNFSSSDFGTGGTGANNNSITVRGDEASGYQFVTRTDADGALGVEGATDRSDAERDVRITISTNNIMNVAVDYGSGFVTELSGIDLEAINGEGSLPTSFKFGFAASTGGSTNIHEIRGLTVQTLSPDVSVQASHGSGFKQGETADITLDVSNDAGAEDTTGTITVTDTLPAGLTPLSASGTGWDCDIAGQTVTCARPGDGANVLAPGDTAPTITIATKVSISAAASVVNTATVTTADNGNADPTDSDTIAIAAMADADGIIDSVEAGAPNGGDANDDGTADSLQTGVTSFVNPVTGEYAVLESGVCDSNSDVSAAAESANDTADGNYTYPAGLLDFALTCGTPGDTATVTQYFFGSHDVSTLVARKYDSVTKTYSTIPGATITAVTIGGEAAVRIVYPITDGGMLDEDGVANGTIVDPAGPAVLAAAVTAPGTTAAAGAPDTGLQASSSFVAYAAAAAGLILVGLGIRSSRLGGKTNVS